MSISELLQRARARVMAEHRPLAAPYPACALFFSVSDGRQRATVIHVCAADLTTAWRRGADKVVQHQRTLGRPLRWLRVDWVEHAQATSWANLTRILEQTKRNYFRFGLAFDVRLKHALLEQELNANAVLFAGSKIASAQFNPGNFNRYCKQRFGKDVPPMPDEEAEVHLLHTRGIFCETDAAPRLLEASGRNAGRRVIDTLSSGQVLQLVNNAADFLAHQVQDNGRFIYGLHPCFDRELSSYNALRHASTTYSMLEAWELSRDPALLQAIERALTCLERHLIRRCHDTAGAPLAFVVDVKDEIKLGANAVAILALVKYSELVERERYADLLTQLAAGIVYMQDRQSGRFTHVLHWPSLQVKNRFRIIYYDGEAAFGLMRLYGLTGDNRWLATVEKAFAHFVAAGHEKAHDHWLSYCVNELTRHRPNETWFRFGLRNVAGYLDFVLTRLTTFPTLLELMMAAEQMLRRIEQLPQYRHLLHEIDLEKFYRALHFRAHYLLNGHFWPELAMYYRNPARVVGSFFIRHHSFRVRIDDVEHYLSGFVAYWKYLQAGQPRVHAPEPLSAQPRDAPQPVIVWGGDVNLGRRTHTVVRRQGPEAPLARLPILREAHLTLVNLECVIATGGQPGVEKGERGPHYYRAHPEMLQVLQKAGIDAVATANNHSGDYGSEALLEQSRWLQQAGIAHAGTGHNFEAAVAPTYCRAGALTVALFSIDATMPHFAAEDDAAGTAYLPLKPAANWTRVLSQRVQHARRCAHLVLVAVHWRWPPTRVPDSSKIAAGHAIIDAGADAVLGASGHTLQGVETYRGRPIIHDAGDLLFDSLESAREGGLFALRASARGISRITFCPLRLGMADTRPAEGDDARDIAHRYANACRALATDARVDAKGRCHMRFHPDARVQTPLADSSAPPVATQSHRDRDRAQAFTPLLNPARLANACAKRAVVETVPTHARISPQQLGPLTLLGLQVSPSRFFGRALVWVNSYWATGIAPERDIQLRIELVPDHGAGQTWGTRSEHDFGDWLAPTSRWRAGPIYHDRYAVRPPASANLGQGTHRVRLTLLQDGQQVASLCPGTTVEQLTPSLPAPVLTQPPLPDAPSRFLFLNRSLGRLRSGIENAALLRARLFREELDLTPAIVTVAYDPQAAHASERLASLGLLPPRVPVFDMYSDLQQNTTDKAAPVACSHPIPYGCHQEPVPHASDYRVRDPDGRMLMYVACHEHDGVDYINHFHDGYKWRRDTYDTRGRVSRIQLFGEEGHKVRLEQYLRPNSSTAVRKHWSANGTGVLIELLDAAGRVTHCFNSESSLIEHWLSGLIADAPTQHHVMVLDRSEIYLAALRRLARRAPRGALTILPMLHSAHVIDASVRTGRLKSYAEDLLQRPDSADRILVLTHQQADDITQRFGRLPLAVIPHHAAPCQSPPAFQSRQRQRLVYLARYASDKNHEAALRIFRIVADTCPQASLHCYGHGPRLPALQKMVRELDMENRVHLETFTPEVADILRHAGLFIMTSQREGLPLSLAESLSHGCPVIAFDIAYGPAQLIRHGQNGFLIPRGDEARFAQQIIDLLHDPVLHERLSTAAPATIQATHSPARVAAQWHALFRELGLNVRASTKDTEDMPG